MMLSKNMNKHSIIQECLDLFFPNGKSQHGELKDMDVELTDFQLKPLEDEETTLGDIIDKAKLQFIHFYLRTKLQKQISDDHDDDDRQKEEEHDQKSSISSTSAISCIVNQRSTESNDKPGKITEGAEEDEHDSELRISSPSAISCKVSKQSTESIDKPGKITEGAEDDVLMKQGSNEYPSIPDSADDSSSLPDHLFFPVSKTVREPKEFGIVVHRGQVLRELIKIFKENPDVDLEET